jgi:hypothetical protein
MMADMCRRQLRFTKSIACGHLTFTGDEIIDCRSDECHLSSAHLENCVTPQCRRYYEKPERLVTKEVRFKKFQPGCLKSHKHKNNRNLENVATVRLGACDHKILYTYHTSKSKSIKAWSLIPPSP